jgi:NAD+ kinase
MRVILFINPKKKDARALAGKIIKELDSLNIVTDTFSFTGKPYFYADENYDVAISLGGDGTVLSTARAMSPKKIPIFPVNLGTFGFIAGIHPLEWRKVFDSWLGGKAPISRRLMFDVTVEREGNELCMGYSLNDVVVSASGKIINLRVSYCEADGKKALKLGQYRSDGLIVSTPTGSTAYSAAAGGPIVDPELEAVILNSICPFTLTHRPMLMPSGEIIVDVDEKQRKGLILIIDGQVTEKLKSGDRIFIKKAPNPCLLIASGRQEFFQALRTKLVWAGGGEGDSS